VVDDSGGGGDDVGEEVVSGDDVIIDGADINVVVVGEDTGDVISAWINAVGDIIAGGDSKVDEGNKIDEEEVPEDDDEDEDDEDKEGGDDDKGISTEDDDVVLMFSLLCAPSSSAVRPDEDLVLFMPCDQMGFLIHLLR